MQMIKDQIKSGCFKPFYLLYGSEDYLKKLYRDKLKAAMIGDSDDMNYSYYEGKDIDVKKIAEIAQTLPFFHDKRLIILENSNLFKSQSELSDLLAELPTSSYIIFIEKEIDKRNKLYKLVKDRGTVAEMNGLDEKNLKLFVASLFQQSGKRITEQLVTDLLDKIGTDMVNIKNEVEKIISYAIEKEVITKEDINSVVTVQITGKIFSMIDALAGKQQKKALALYYDLLHLREKPLSILFLITRHFNIMLQVKDMNSQGYSQNVICEKVGVPPFAVNKYIAQAKNFTMKRLHEIIEFGTEVEEHIKTGRMVERIGVELLIVTFSS